MSKFTGSRVHEMKMRCVVQSVVYQNETNGFSILRIATDESIGVKTLVCTGIDFGKGTELECEGEWKNDPKYGLQFQATECREVIPETLEGIEKYLASGLIKGIGKKYAADIVNHFGYSTFDVIDTDIERLREVPGIGTKKIAQIRQSWDRQKAIRDIMVFLQGCGVSSTYAAKIYRFYQGDSIRKVRENPYRLADEIWGIGFKTADQIAAHLGFNGEDERRCRAGLVYTLRQLSLQGHVYATESQLLASACSLLEVGEEPLKTAMEGMLKAERLVREGEDIYLPQFHEEETEVAARLLALAGQWKRQSGASLPELEKLYGPDGVRYDEVQLGAIAQAVQHKVMVLTGGPGTGKTTTTLGIIRALSARGLRVLLAAPTGRAAKRMSEATGYPSRTIHRLLEYNPMDGCLRNEQHPLQGDALIVDECSMIDISLMASLMRALPDRMRLILVGDIDQLPSVGSGNVLRDIIASGAVPVVRLDRIFRQAMKSRIVMSAHAINRGELPDLSNGKETDFFFLRREEGADIAAEIVSLVKDRLPKAYGEAARNIQVLSPMQKGPVGTIALNHSLQEALNPNGEGLKRGQYVFRPGDKVMQVRNNYDKEVFNGDLGMVRKVDLEEKELTVDFDGTKVTYEGEELDELILAYATTIHKSQGSEYPMVVIPVVNAHYVMLQRNLIYTAITRSKKLCVLIGSLQALQMAVRTQESLSRNTRLKERLEKGYEKNDRKR